MKIATGIIGIILGILVLLQSCTVGVGGGLANDQATSDAGAVGMLAAMLFFVGGAFAFALPVVSMVVFTLAGIIAISAAATSQFGDLNIWGIIALILAVFAFFAWRSDKKKKAQTPPAVPQ
jgi:hypothetical protein